MFWEPKGKRSKRSSQKHLEKNLQKKHSLGLQDMQLTDNIGGQLLPGAFLNAGGPKS